jgi:subtilisin-like proprotein convertase family protein
VLDPGETAILPITLRNSGDADATTVAGNLFSAIPDVLKVYDGTASYSDIVVNGQETSVAPHFEVTLEPNASCGDWLGANMAVTGDGFEVGSGLTLEIGQYEGDRPSTDTPISIPKTTDGVWSFLDVPSTFPVTEVDVTLNIAHADISQLRVVLYAPDNSLVILHDHTGAGVSGLNTTYDELTEPAVGSMQDFVGVDPQGSWRIKVSDNVGGGTQAGTLQDWTLHFKSDIPFDCNPVSCGEAVPPAVGDTVIVDKSGVSDLQISWSGVGASDYNVWRSTDRQLKTATHAGASGGATSLVDAGAQSLPGVCYYVVRSVNSCRWESP